mgnify:FL=1
MKWANPVQTAKVRKSATNLWCTRHPRICSTEGTLCLVCRRRSGWSASFSRPRASARSRYMIYLPLYWERIRNGSRTWPIFTMPRTTPNSKLRFLILSEPIWQRWSQTWEVWPCTRASFTRKVGMHTQMPSASCLGRNRSLKNTIRKLIRYLTRSRLPQISWKTLKSWRLIDLLRRTWSAYFPI